MAKTTAPTDAEPSGAQLASDRPVPIGGRLARALGADHTTFSSIVDVAMQNPDSRVRADALRVAFRIVDAEPELRASVLDVLDHWNDVQLAGWLTHVAGDYAAEIVRRTARSARSGALRGRAQAVERIFEAGG